MQVLQQGVTQHVVIGGRLDDGGNGLQSGELRGAPTAFAHDELVRTVHPPIELVGRLVAFLLLACCFDLGGRTLPHDDRLEDADLLDRGGQLIVVVLIEDGTRLMGIRTDVRQLELGQITAGDRLQFRLLVLAAFLRGFT